MEHERLWLEFVNTDDIRRGERVDSMRDFAALVRWLETHAVLDTERAVGMHRRAEQQPAGASAALADARRIRAALRTLAERGAHEPRVRRCADPNCTHVFLDSTKNGRRRWCDMRTCGNRAKAARHRTKVRG